MKLIVIRHDAGCILSSVLKNNQTLIEILNRVVVAGGSYNSTHTLASTYGQTRPLGFAERPEIRVRGGSHGKILKMFLRNARIYHSTFSRIRHCIHRHMTIYAICLSFAFTQFRMRLATVMGPTPPGTGVIAEAFFTTSSKSTSPTRPSRVWFMPTSTTTTPSFTASPVIIFGFPIAAIRISAPRVMAARSLVLLWQIVTVASRLRSITAIGFPTILLRPTITACLPATAIL